jgi:hypothetical protein
MFGQRSKFAEVYVEITTVVQGVTISGVRRLVYKTFSRQNGTPGPSPV